MSWNFAYDSPSAITALLEGEGLSMSKKFGQNFLLSQQVRERIVQELRIPDGGTVWEIGPGLGALTTLLVARNAQVTAFEIDHGFCRILREQAFVGDTNFRLVEGDVLKTWEQVSAADGIPDRICGNLPYNVGSVCIARFLEKQCLPERMVYTLQKEVADRLCADFGDKDWSSFTILAKIDYEVELSFTIKSVAFYPSPNVTSAVIGMQRRKTPLVSPELRPIFLPMVKELFAQRRKTVKNNLQHGKAGSLLGKAGVERLLADCEVPPNERAERLDIPVLIRMAQHIASRV